MDKEFKNLVLGCQNCKKDFMIESGDFNFYERIKVPSPTWCPDCRCIRRMVHRNEKNLHRRTCDITGKNIISIYTADCPYTICDKDYYFSDDFDPFKFGKQYDFDSKFFEQFYEFAKKVPLASLFVTKSQNCDYNQDTSNSSNCYLCFRNHYSKNMSYCYRGNKSNDCIDCFQVVEGSEFLYECVYGFACSSSKFIHFCEKCFDSAFLYNCVGCVDCFMCSNLRNKQCCFRNEQYSREDYKKIIDSYNLSTYSGQQKALVEFEDFIKKFPRKNLTIVRSDNVAGDTIFESKNCHHVFNIKGSENCSYSWDSRSFFDSMDTYSGASAELIYESTATTNHSSNCHFCLRVYEGSRDCEYCWFLQNCSNCFGCVSLRHKEYCIFNIQYSKEDYFEILKKIKDKMIEDKEYGEFFPLYTSPFPYNDTVAHEYFPKDEKWAKEKSMEWGSFEEKNYKVTISSGDLIDDIKEVTDSILQEVISCKHDGECLHGCTKAFKITNDELSFYRRRGIPLPRECPNCRYYRRLAYRNFTSLKETVCMCDGENKNIFKNTVLHQHGAGACNKKIETTIDPNSGFIIYCEECYKKEVY